MMRNPRSPTRGVDRREKYPALRIAVTMDASRRLRITT
jgi:hypothetical protein